jgi:hypothetical protein
MTINFVIDFLISLLNHYPSKYYSLNHFELKTPLLRTYSSSLFETSSFDGYSSVVFALCDFRPLMIAIGIKVIVVFNLNMNLIPIVIKNLLINLYLFMVFDQR